MLKTYLRSRHGQFAKGRNAFLITLNGEAQTPEELSRERIERTSQSLEYLERAEKEEKKAKSSSRRANLVDLFIRHAPLLYGNARAGAIKN